MARIKNQTPGAPVYVLVWPVYLILLLTGAPGLQSIKYSSGMAADAQVADAPNDMFNPGLLFTRADADKIMGESTHLTDSSFNTEPHVTSYLCGYKADVKDHKTGKTGAIYFLFEQYKDISEAKIKYESIYLANKPHGAEKVSNLGEEAYYHTDGENFYFIMVRKGKYVFNIKVNKTTSTTSLNEFKKTAGRIAASI